MFRFTQILLQLTCVIWYLNFIYSNTLSLKQKFSIQRHYRLSVDYSLILKKNSTKIILWNSIAATRENRNAKNFSKSFREGKQEFVSVGCRKSCTKTIECGGVLCSLWLYAWTSIASRVRINALLSGPFIGKITAIADELALASAMMVAFVK